MVVFGWGPLHGNGVGRDPIKILTIGSSFAVNATHFLPDLGQSQGVEIVVTKANIGGSDLERHARYLRIALRDPSDPEGKPYWERDDPNRRHYSLVEMLERDHWDFVTLQQFSGDSFKPETYEPASAELIAVVRAHAPDARIVVHETWAYRSDHPIYLPSPSSSLSPYEAVLVARSRDQLRSAGPFSQTAMHADLKAAYGALATRYGLLTVPVGDAFQIARAMPEWHFVHPDPTFDYAHPPPEQRPDQTGSLIGGWHWRTDTKTGQREFALDAKHANVAGQYLGACVFYETLVGQRVGDDAWRPPELTAGQADSLRGAAHRAVLEQVKQPTKVAPARTRPNIVLVMTDDQGWGETGYYQHPVLRTPELDRMAANGLRFDRFYAGAPVCSPTRATVLTGRSNDRTGVPTHGHALRRQEKSLASALQAEGYATAHFGKWHLDGLRGPGAPILADDTHHPGKFGFEQWLSVTNFFDLNPLMGRNGAVEAFRGDSSTIVVDEALKFIRGAVHDSRPFFAVVWDGSPHGPWVASDADRRDLADLNFRSQHHYGELVAFDRALGHLRKGLRDLGVAENTLVWYCSDNGGLPGMIPDTVGGLRGHKSELWEGGIRVPGVIEWPAAIVPRVSSYPASTMDIFPTLAAIVGLPSDAMLDPVDGANLAPLFAGRDVPRVKPIPFRFEDGGAWIDNDYKLVVSGEGTGGFKLYDLTNDPTESRNLAAVEPERLGRMGRDYEAWSASVDRSVAGQDYPAGRVDPTEPESHPWSDDARYQPYLETWRQRPEYSNLPAQNFHLAEDMAESLSTQAAP
ncbi:sulfatase-like hydrolase/transferase [Synoicihabitans lomoniglobus]|uniref:Sulfatase-like hydrolase/transferase n=2 Tax=Synoicihabitans lomoniglobus TaxID=2909285 RepID=A0AAF0CSZ9_9BACT|nr:sulfatase-like hydrolase/transferase [Opitutaceae bacterium LMO-M01]